MEENRPPTSGRTPTSMPPTNLILSICCLVASAASSFKLRIQCYCATTILWIQLILRSFCSRDDIINRRQFNEITGKSRSDTEIKLVWKRMKLSAKLNVSNHRREQSQTGGGEKPPSPSPEDLAIMAIAPHDFIVEVNDFDSDAVIPMPASKELTGSSNEYMDSITTPEIAGPSIGPIAGPSIEFADLTLEENLVPIVIEEEVVSSNKPGDKRRPTRKQNSLNRTEEMHQSITSSNINYKKQHIKMMEIEHSININYKKRQKEIMEIEHLDNVKIAQLKIKKLELEIALLEHKNNTIE